VATLRASGRGDLFVLGHDLTATTRGALIDGTLNMLLSLPRRELAERTVDAMMDWFTSKNRLEGTRQFILPIDIYTPESL